MRCLFLFIIPTYQIYQQGNDGKKSIPSNGKNHVINIILSSSQERNLKYDSYIVIL